MKMKLFIIMLCIFFMGNVYAANTKGQKETLADYIMNLPLQNEKSTPGAGLYHHNGTFKDGDTILDANDGSYRYAGKDTVENPINNYVCMDSDATSCPEDKLYRIIGVFDGKVKVIKNTSIGDIKWNLASPAYHYGSNTWSRSNLKRQLNGELDDSSPEKNYYNSIESLINSGKIEKHTWSVGGNTMDNIARVAILSVAYQNEVVNPSGANSITGEKYWTGYIGLMYASDYGFAAEPSNWGTTLESYIGVPHNSDWL